MNAKTAAKSSAPCCDRIMEVASDLFFKQGYHATGINQIIEESGVAKATFYSHFKSKDELCKCYLENLKDGEGMNMDRFIAAAKNPVERFLAPIHSMEPWLVATDFRGCPFVNIASEVPDPTSPLRSIGMNVYSDVGKKIENTCKELIESSPEKYGHLNVKELTRSYVLIFAGAVALAELYHDIWPARDAAKAIKKLIEA